MRFFSTISLVAVLTGSLAAKADTTYLYTGATYNFERAPYTGTDFVSGSITFEDPLPSYRGPSPATPVSYSFSDGLQTLDQTNSHGEYFFLATDSQGAIDQYQIRISDAAGDLIQLTDAYGSRSDFVSHGSSFATSGSAGSFAEAPAMAATPEPSSLMLLGTGLAGLSGIVRRRLA